MSSPPLFRRDGALVRLDLRRADAGPATDGLGGGAVAPRGDLGEAEDIFEAFPVGLARIDDKGIILAANERLVQLLGRRLRTTVGRPLVSLLSPASRRDVLHHLARAFVSGGYEHAEARLGEDDGGRRARFVHLSTSRESDGPGGQRRALVSFFETTEQREAEARLQQSEASHRALIESLPDAVWVHRQGRLVYANAAARGLLEWGDGHVEGQALAAWIHPDDREAAAEHWARAAESRRHLGPWELRVVDTSGRSIDVEAHEVTSVFEGSWANATIARDLTERRRLQAQLIQNDRLASMGTLSAGIAHEVNNPLSFILTNLETALEALPPSPSPLAEVRESLEEAWEGAVRVKELVREMRKLSHFDDEERPVDLDEVAEAALRVARKEIEYRAGVRTELVGAGEARAVALVLGNRGQLFQVALNLLLNAAQALSPRAPEAAVGRGSSAGSGATPEAPHQVVVRTRVTGRWVVLEVEDDGPGIPEAVLPRVFEPFFTTKPVGEGTGLGLAICRGIVLSHGGDLLVDSEVGRGTRVEVRLPKPEPSRLSTVAPERPPSLPPSAPPPAGPRRRMLLIDDEVLVGRSVARSLRGRHDLELACSKDEAAAILSEGRDYDLVLCDVMMPGGSGVDVHGWVRRHRPELLPRLVMMTGGVFLPEAEAFLDREEVPFVSKPLEREAIEWLLAARGASDADGTGSGVVAAPGALTAARSPEGR